MKSVGSIEIKDKTISLSFESNNAVWVDTTINRFNLSPTALINGIRFNDINKIIELMVLAKIIKVMVINDDSSERGQVEMLYKNDLFISEYYKFFIYNFSEDQIQFFVKNLIKSGKGEILDSNVIWYKR